MKNVYYPKHLPLHTLYIDEFVFVNNAQFSDVTIFGAYLPPAAQEVETADFCCSFSLLNQLLSKAGDVGKWVIEEIVDKLIYESENEPITINIKNIFGKPLIISNLNLKMYQPMQQDPFGNWVNQNTDEDFYLIEDI